MVLKTKTITIAVAAFMVSLLAVAAARAQQPTVEARAVRPVSVEGDLLDPTKAVDGQPNTRAVSSRPNYAGQSIIIDVGGEQNIAGVIQDHGRWPAHYAGAYKVEVAESASGPWVKTFEGPGNRGESKAIFEAVRGRFIRITATSDKGGGDDWTVAELKAVVDPGARPRQRPAPPVEQPGPTFPEGGARIAGSLKDLQLALDGNIETRATSGTPNYAAMSVTLDLGGEYEISRVIQLHGKYPDDYPAEYKVEATRRKDERDFREVWRGAGQSGRSVARFTPITTRYLRITALKKRNDLFWWSIAELRTNRDEDVVDRGEEDARLQREIRRATGQGFSNVGAATDPSEETRATTNRPDYVGSHIVLDLGGSYTVSRVAQVHDPQDRDYPGRYRVEVSEDGNNWKTVWEGEGQPGRSRANFTPVRARYVRITATGTHNNRNPWSIADLRVSG